MFLWLFRESTCILLNQASCDECRNIIYGNRDPNLEAHKIHCFPTSLVLICWRVSASVIPQNRRYQWTYHSLQTFKPNTTNAFPSNTHGQKTSHNLCPYVLLTFCLKHNTLSYLEIPGLFAPSCPRPCATLPSRVPPKDRSQDHQRKSNHRTWQWQHVVRLNVNYVQDFITIR